MSALVSLFLNASLSFPEMSFSKVRRYALTERLHTVPELTIEVLCEDPALDLAAMIGETAVAFLEEPCFPRFDGIVRAVEQQSAEEAGTSCYAITLTPALWLTTERSGHHIFRDLSVLEIAAEVAARPGHRIAPPELRLSRAAEDWPRYDYRVQYGETDRDFLFRILAEDGLVSCWTPSADDPQKLVWTLTDDTSIGGPAIDVPFRPPFGALAAKGPHVRAVKTSARLVTSEARLRDYDHEKPAFPLESRWFAGDAVAAEQPLVRYSYAVGDFRDDTAGLDLAQIRLQAARARSRVYRWETSFAAPAGAIVRLHDHPREDANGDFLVVAMRAEVEPTRRSHVAELVPAAFPWRPEVPAKPRIHGTQTAFVVGAPGKEIDVDKQGRVEVRFHWDTRSNGTSRRVRVAMPWMGTDRGFWTPPRVGDEVVIAYHDGDPDEPVIVGSVNNAVAPPAAILPKYETQTWWKSKSTGGGDGYNAILMDDQKGHELLGLRAERDLVVEAVHDSTTTIGGGSALSVVQGQSVKVGGDVTAAVVGKCEVSAGEVEVVSKGDINFNANGARNDSAETFHYTSAPSVYVAGKHLVEITSQDQITLKVGSASITMVDGKITLSAPLIELNP